MDLTSSTFITSFLPNATVRGALALRNAVVQKFEVELLVLALDPGEEKLRHAGVGFDAVGERVVDRLVAAELQPAIPRALDERLPGA